MKYIYNIHLVLKKTPIFPFRHILKILYHYIFGLSQISKKKKRFPNLSMEISCRYIHFIQTFKIMGSPHSLPLSCVDRNLSQKILTAWWEVQLHFDGVLTRFRYNFKWFRTSIGALGSWTSVRKSFRADVVTHQK